jgi:polysaccharide pyruvyl transferase WcaK-like protein
MTSNRGDMAIRKSIADAITKKIDIPIAFFNLKYEELTERRIINQVNKDGSVFIIAGSGLYTNYPKSSGWYFPCKTELFNKIKVPIILLGIGANNNLKGDIYGELKEETKKSIKLINDLAVISTVRDMRTYQLLSSLGITKHQLILDSGNFLSTPSLPKEKRVAINVAQHGSFDIDLIEELVKEREKNILYFSKIIHYLENKNYKIVFIAHDALEQSLIIDLLKLCPNLEYLNTDNLDLMLQEYARCEFSIGIRMHSNIMSFATSTPFISLYYDQKSIEYNKLIDWSEFGYSVFEDYYPWLQNKVDDLIKYHNDYSQKFDEIKQIEQIKFDKIIGKICNIIKTSI